ncbi:hypothetical protein V3C99_007660 [Haemonchus contortus]
MHQASWRLPPHPGVVTEATSVEPTEDYQALKKLYKRQEWCQIHILSKVNSKAAIVRPIIQSEFYITTEKVTPLCREGGYAEATTWGEIIVSKTHDFSRINRTAKYRQVHTPGIHDTEDYFVHNLIPFQEQQISQLTAAVRSRYTVVERQIAICPWIAEYVDGPMILKPFPGGIIGRTLVRETYVLPEMIQSSVVVIRQDGEAVEKYFDPSTRLILNEPSGFDTKLVAVS